MKTNFFPLLLLMIVFVVACSTKETPPSAESPPPPTGDVMDFKLDVKKYTLENGLRLLVYENRRLPILAFYTFFDTGGRHEDIAKGNTGASHFLEHMLFKTTKNYPVPGTIDRLISKSGGLVNASTNMDRTAYIEMIPSAALDLLIKINLDRVANLTLLDPLFESERKVIMEERKMRYENSPWGQLYLASMQALFEGTPYGGSVIGSKRDLENLTKEDTWEFYKSFYTPDNAVIVIAGDVDAHTVKEKIAKAYGKMERSTPEIQEYRKKVDNPRRYRYKAKLNREFKLHGQSPHPIFKVVYPGEAAGTRQDLATDLLVFALGKGESSYLHQKYVKGKHSLLSHVDASNHSLKFNGVLNVSGTLLPGVNLEKFKRRLLKDLPSFCKKGLTPRVLQKTKNQHMQLYYRTIQTNFGVASFLGSLESFYGDYRRYREFIDVYNSITLEEIQKVCRDVLKPKKHLFFSLWNKHPQPKRK